MIKNSLIINKKLEIFFKILFSLSCPAINLMFYRSGDRNILFLSLAVSFLIGIFLSFKLFKYKFNEINIFRFILVFLFANLFLRTIYNYHFDDSFSWQYYGISLWKLIITSLLSLYGLSFLLYFLLLKIGKPIINFFKSFNLKEKKFLLIYSALFLIFILIFYNITGIFYFYEDYKNACDYLYTTDNFYVFNSESFINLNSPCNDFGKQPLFGLFSAPFGVIVLFLSNIFFFIPNSYAIFMALFQVLLSGISIIMLGRMMGNNISDKTSLYIFYLCCFSTIFFVLVIEQYVISTFYLITMIYTYFNMKKGTNYIYACGVGALTTSAFLFPLAAKEKKLKDWLLSALDCLVFFLIVLILFGQIRFLFEFIQNLFINVDNFSGKSLTFLERFQQYLSFVKSIFMALPSYVVDKAVSSQEHYQYLIQPIYHFSKVGICILIITILGFILNRKNKIAIVSFAWVIFSFIVIGVAGYGTAEMGTNLYGFYFGWAYICLVYMFIDKVLKNDKYKRIIIIILCLILLCINIPELINIIKFGIKYFPAF